MLRQREAARWAGGRAGEVIRFRESCGESTDSATRLPRFPPVFPTCTASSRAWKSESVA
ncbi:hypothetical protein Ga0080574_TMP3221 [Salipiger abyssi]|uniref:Uncharacterized protein n=1 Tax=Salipiger abyssi TaxID=1250539 RepID=A0A1P8UVX8_9RHOB|nr:hypothetical protein Ga0080574_TMP3221 [Salipiger abyssi]